MRPIPFTLRGASASGVGLLGTQMVSFAIELAVARHLGAADLGILAIGTGSSSTVGATIVAGFSSAASTYVARSHEAGASRAVGGHFRLALSLALAVSAFATAFLLVVAQPLAEVLIGPGAVSASVIRVFAISLPFQAVGGVATAVALALGRPVAEIRYRWSDAAIRALALPALLLLNANVIDVAVLHLIAAAVASAVSLHIAFGMTGREAGSVRHEFGDAASLAAWQAVTTASWLAARRLDVAIVAAILGAQSAGSYRLAVVLASLAGITMLALQSVFYPVAARRLASGGRPGLEDHYRRVVRFAVTATAPIAALLITFHEQMIVFFGAPFADAGTALVILAVGQQVLASGGHSTTVVQVVGASGRAALNAALAAVFQISVLFLLAPVIGLSGAAVASVLGTLMTHVLQLRTLAGFGIHLVERRWLLANAPALLLFAAASVVDRMLGVAPVVSVALILFAALAYATVVVRVVLPASERGLLADLILGSRATTVPG